MLLDSQRETNPLLIVAAKTRHKSVQQKGGNNFGACHAHLTGKLFE